MKIDTILFLIGVMAIFSAWLFSDYLSLNLYCWLTVGGLLFSILGFGIAKIKQDKVG